MPDRFADLIGFQAGTAEFYLLHSVLHFGPDLVQVRIEAALGGIHSMAAMVTYLGAFSADITYSRHDFTVQFILTLVPRNSVPLF